MTDITRRTVLKSVAWSAPAVTVATAAPAFATSQELDCDLKGTREPCGREYEYRVSVGCKVGAVASVYINGKKASVVRQKNKVYYAVILRQKSSALPVAVKVTDGKKQTEIVKSVPFA